MSVGVFAGYEEPEGHELDDLRSDSPRLTKIPYMRPDPEPEADLSDSTPSPPRRNSSPDPAQAELIGNLGPNNPELAQIRRHPLEPRSKPSSSRDTDMTDPCPPAQTLGPGSVGARPELPPLTSIQVPPTQQRGANDGMSISGIIDAGALEAKAAAAVRQSEDHLRPRGLSNDDGAPRSRVDSAQEQPELSPLGKPPSPNSRSSALRLKTTVPPPSGMPESLSDSLSRHTLSNTARGPVQSLPSLQHSPPLPSGQSDSLLANTQRLPSIGQMVSEQMVPLNQLAEVAGQREPAPAAGARPHSHSIGSISSPSSYFPPYPAAVHRSPSTSSPYTISGRSPTSTISEPQHTYHSPSTFPSPSATYHFANRRSGPSDHHHRPSFPPSLPSASSSGSNQTRASSSTEGYSTQHTTPLDSTPLPDVLPRPTLPLPPGMVPQNFLCEWPGCTAPPFQTQYTLR